MALEFVESCESCNHCYKLYKHPGNQPPFRGDMTTWFGYVCAGLQCENKMVFFDRIDGLCEMYSKREE